MLERWITALRTEDAGLEEPSATRDRLKDRFPKNATRRMSQLGLLLGAALEPLRPTADDALVYASAYAETRALEAYLDSFPAASPTLFQTSIHPSAVQQSFIVRQQALRQFFPVTGGAHLSAQAVLVALLAATPRAILCGGEERGTWLLAHGRASSRTFAFALALSNDPAGALARLALDSAPPASLPSPVPLSSVALSDSLSSVALSLSSFFDLLHNRRPFDAAVLPGRRLILEWIP